MIENQIKVETLASLQENQPRTHNWVQKITQKMGNSKCSVCRQLKKSGYKNCEEAGNSTGY